jgi:hypothetical protein
MPLILPPPVAWATHHDEPMLFPSRDEAASYCGDDERPIELCDRAAVLKAIASYLDSNWMSAREYANELRAAAVKGAT